MGSFSYTPHAVLCGAYLLHALAVLCGEFLLHALAVLCGQYLLHVLAVLCGKVLLHLTAGVSLTRPVLFYVGSFSYTPNAGLCGGFLLYTP